MRHGEGDSECDESCVVQRGQLRFLVDLSFVRYRYLTVFEEFKLVEA